MEMASMNLKNFADSTKALKDKFGDRIISNRSLANLNTFGTGGAARLFFDAATIDELSSIIGMATRLGIPAFLLGGGSNLLVSDKGYDGLVIKNSIMGIELKENEVICGAGENLQAVVDFAFENSLTGLEFATGIYGTVGGAIYGNAGAYGSETGNILKHAQLVDRQGNIRIEERPYFEFGYRDSKLKRTGEIVTRAGFALNLGKKELIRAKIDEIRRHRNNKPPINKYTAGCFFKNIPDKRERFGKLSAGKLLDEVGAKGEKFGGAEVFEKHANIIINDGSASSSDIRRLAKRLKIKVKERFNIDLTEEITLLGTFEEESI
jgi:UDP-N-acetylmuramate dehydrogenase